MTATMEVCERLHSGERAARDFDIAFVGAGASTAYTLLNLVQSLPAIRNGRVPKIAVFERDGDAFSGVPYGDRAARTALLITSLRDFLPDHERRMFSDWLGRNKSWIFDEFLHSVGELGARWWAEHRAEIQRDEFDSLFLPRYTFGRYLVHRTRSALARAERERRATAEILRDEVRVLQTEGGWYVVRGAAVTIRARRVVLAVGSPPALSRLTVGPPQSDAVLLDRPFDQPEMGIGRVTSGLQNVPAGQRPHVVVIGGNASTMDMLFQINDLRIPQVRQAEFTVLVPSGYLPDRLARIPSERPYRAEELGRLESQKSVSARAVYEAARADIASGRRVGLGAGDSLPVISSALGRMLPNLSPRETAEFAARWGPELGRHQRRAGWEYYEVIDRLRAEDRLRVIAGAFRGLGPAEHRGVRVLYEQAGQECTLPSPADVVINCAGPARDLRHAGVRLLDQLISSGLCQVSPSGTGILVNSSFEAAPGLFVMGPLLAGNVVAGKPIWHMEHCGRISAYGAILGAMLVSKLIVEPGRARVDEEVGAVGLDDGP